jgi:hypothetical protein
MARKPPLADQLSPAQRSEQERKLFSVMGWNLQGHIIGLIIAKSEADAEYYALHELGFVKVDGTSLASDCVYVAPDETKE